MRERLDKVQFIKSKLTDAEAPVDVQAMWSGIESALDDAENTRRPLGFMWFCLALVLSSAVIGIGWKLSDANPATPSTPVEESPKATPVQFAEVLNKETTINKEESTDELYDASIPTEEVNDAASVATKIRVDATDLKTRRMLDFSETLNHELNFSEIIAFDSNESHDFNVSKSNIENSSIRTVDSKNTKLILNESSDLSDIHLISQAQTIEPIKPVQTLQLQSPSHDIALGSNDMIFVDAKTKSWAITPSVSAGSFITNFDWRQIEENGLIERNNSFEKDLVGVQLSGRLNVQHKKGISFETGVDYRNHITKFQHNSTIEFDTTLLNVLLSTNTDVETGEVTEMFGDTTITASKTLDVLNYNKYKSLRVPLLVGYHLPLKKGWELGAKAGIAMDFFTKQDGLVVGTSDQINELSSLKFKSFSTSLLMSAHITKQLTRFIALSVRPEFSMGLTNTLDSEIVERHQYSLGVNAGLEFRF